MPNRRRVLQPDSDLEEIFLMWYRNREALAEEPTRVADHFKEHETMIVCSFEKHINAFLDADSEYYGLHMKLAGLKTDFRQTGKPLAAIEAYILAIQADCLPPPWVLESLHGYLGEWYEAQGKKSLDECFGLSRKQGQKQNALQLARQRQRNQFLCFMVFVLQSCLPRLSVETAARLVVETFSLPPELEIDNIAESTLKLLYDQEWSKLFVEDSMLRNFRDEVSQWSDEERRRFVCAFRGGKEIVVKLSPPETFQLNCLQCGDSFKSTNRLKNRRCERCRSKND